jgi:hypothetical protein
VAAAPSTPPTRTNPPPPAPAPLPPIVAPLAPTDSRAWPFTPDLVHKTTEPSPFIVGAVVFVVVFFVLGTIAFFFFRP